MFPTKANIDKYEEQSKLCKQLVNKDYNNYINIYICDQLDSGDSKSLYKFIANKKGSSNTIKKIEGCTSNDNFAICEKFADAFASVFTTDNNQPANLAQSPCSQENSIMFQTLGVLKQLNTLDVRKGAGPDRLSPALLRFLAPYIYITVTHFFQYAYDSHSTPADWKTAHIIPLHKKGCRQDPLNYRPISLTCILSKVFEHVISHDIHSFLGKFDFLYEHQHGFRKHRGCDTQLLNTVIDLVNFYDDNIPIDVAVLDFSKAFDVVSHNKLISKLFAIGIHPTTCKWITSWLSDRNLCVTANYAHSRPRLVTSGVPQGSVLGPLLFLIFINDMPSTVTSSSLKLFADDSLLYHPIHQPDDLTKLQDDLDSLFAWSEKSQINFNISKCQHIRIARSKSDCSSHTYTMSSEPITSVHEVKYLGITIDEKLSFDTHISDICTKANRTLLMLMRTLKKARRRTRILAYNTICRPRLEYASQTWSPHLRKHIALIEAVNRKAFRWCFNLRKFDHITDLMLLNNWPTLSSRRANSDLKLYLRIVSGEACVDRDKFVPHQSENHNTRFGGLNGIVNTDVKKYFFHNRVFRAITN